MNTIELKVHRGHVTNRPDAGCKSVVFVPVKDQTSFRVTHTVIPGRQAESWGIRQSRIVSINQMIIKEWHPQTVSALLEHLTTKNCEFQLILQNKCEPKKVQMVKFNWCGTGFRFIVSDVGYEFEKKLCLLPSGPIQAKKCQLFNKKFGRCVVITDEETLSVERMQDEKHAQSVAFAYEYVGREDYRESRHYSRTITVFALKLKHHTSDAMKCIGVTHSDTVSLLASDIPDCRSSSCIQTQHDCRFFYTIIFKGLKAFESTQFESHFLAVKPVDNNPDSFCLYLKFIDVKEPDESFCEKNPDVFFKIVILRPNETQNVCDEPDDASHNTETVQRTTLLPPG